AFYSPVFRFCENAVVPVLCITATGSRVVISQFPLQAKTKAPKLGHNTLGSPVVVEQVGMTGIEEVAFPVPEPPGQSSLNCTAASGRKRSCRRDYNANAGEHLEGGTKKRPGSPYQRFRKRTYALAIPRRPNQNRARVMRGEDED